MWLNTNQMDKLFDRDFKTIRKHINSSLKEECDNSVVANFAITAKDEKQIIDNNTLAALTLLIAESNPKEKEVLIDLIMNILTS